MSGGTSWKKSSVAVVGPTIQTSSPRSVHSFVVGAMRPSIGSAALCWLMLIPGFGRNPARNTSRRTARRSATSGMTRPAIEWPTRIGLGGALERIDDRLGVVGRAQRGRGNRQIHCDDAMPENLELGPQSIPAPSAVVGPVHECDVHPFLHRECASAYYGDVVPAEAVRIWRSTERALRRCQALPHPVATDRSVENPAPRPKGANTR